MAQNLSQTFIIMPLCLIQQILVYSYIFSNNFGQGNVPRANKQAVKNNLEKNFIINNFMQKDKCDRTKTLTTVC